MRCQLLCSHLVADLTFERLKAEILFFHDLIREQHALLNGAKIIAHRVEYADVNADAALATVVFIQLK